MTRDNNYQNIIKQNYYKSINNGLDYRTIISLVSSFLGLYVMMNIFAQDDSLP